MNIFISCGKKKRECACRAIDMYIGNYFKAEAEAAKALGGKIWILSAKYGLLSPDDVITPYNLRLSWLNAIQRKIWADNVIKQMQREGINFNEQAIFLCGNDYSKLLVNYFPNRKTLTARSMSDRIAKLKQITNRKEQQ